MDLKSKKIKFATSQGYKVSKQMEPRQVVNSREEFENRKLSEKVE